MTDTIELEVAIMRAGLSKRAVAERLGLSKMGLYNKINNVSEFKASEIMLLADLLSIPNLDVIFFTQQGD